MRVNAISSDCRSKVSPHCHKGPGFSHGAITKQRARSSRPGEHVLDICEYFVIPPAHPEIVL